MKNFFSRYRPSYIKTFVYMLQSSEYNTGDYVAWLHRTRDFSKVTKRGSLDLTKKVRLLLAFSYLLLGLLWFGAILILVVTGTEFIWAVLVAIAILLIQPYLLAYGIVFPLWLGEVLIQKPKEKQMVASSKQKLASHTAVKIAIAGSYGKTSMREILAAVLGEGKKVAAPPHSYNTPIGISKFIEKLSGDVEILIFELGEYYPGDIATLCDLVQPDIGIITGINEAHLSKFKDISSTQATIFELGDYLNGKPLYVNAQNKLTRQKAKDYKTIEYSELGCNSWHLSGAKLNVQGTDFVAEKAKTALQLHTNLLGEHQLGALSCAIAMAEELGLSKQQIAKGIAETRPFEHRMQPYQLNGAWVIDDTYNGNIDGIEAGLKLLKSLKAKRKIYVTPGLVEQGSSAEAIHVRIGKLIAKAQPDEVVLMGNSVTDYIKQGLKAGKFNNQLKIESEPPRFYAHLDSFVAEGDIVMLQNDWPDNYN